MLGVMSPLTISRESNSQNEAKKDDDEYQPTFVFQPATPDDTNSTSSPLSDILDEVERELQSAPESVVEVANLEENTNEVAMGQTSLISELPFTATVATPQFESIDDRIPETSGTQSSITSLLAAVDSGDLGSSQQHTQPNNVLPQVDANTVPSLPSPKRQHPYGSISSQTSPEASGSAPKVSSSSVGALRNRRGHVTTTLSIYPNSATAFASNSAQIGKSSGQGRIQEPVDLTRNESETATCDTPERTVKMGDHAFKIPLSSPVIQPQIQASVRVTSTGKPSHARKVPDNHVKRPRNAFILFRSYACTSKLLPDTLGITDHKQVSRVVGKLWKDLKPEERAIWEKKAQEEKEEHKLKNPNYRYRPVYRREGVVRRRKRKATDEEDAEEEDRKSEVKARILLEGRQVDEDELEREIEEQRIRDQQEGRERVRNTRSRSRSNSHGNNGNTHTTGMKNGRPNSAPPSSAELPNIDDNGNMVFKPSKHLLGVETRQSGRNRARTLPSIDTDRSCQIAMPSNPLFYGHQQPLQQGLLQPAYHFNTPYNQLGVASPRTLSAMQQLFQVPDTMHPEGTMLTGPECSGLKVGTFDNVTLLSPSFSRKFSLGRWEVPSQMPVATDFPESAQQMLGAMQQTAYTAYDSTGNVPIANNVDRDVHASYTYDTLASVTPQPFGQNVPVYPHTPTYVYLSKEDAQNQQIVEHYLSQGYGVSYDA